jgi:hypothetical protein
MTGWPDLAVAGRRFALLITVGVSGRRLCPQWSERCRRATSRVALATHQSVKPIVYAKELA